MAKYKSSYITRQEQLTSSLAAESANLTGKLPLVQHISYMVPTSPVLAATDTIDLFDLPPGCVIIPQLSSVTCADPAGGVFTLDIGDAVDADRYAVGINIAAGGSIGFASTTAVAAGITTPHLPTATSRVIATVATLVTPTAGVVLNFLVAYRIKG
jgi:hypothetical protein